MDDWDGVWLWHRYVHSDWNWHWSVNVDGSLNGVRLRNCIKNKLNNKLNKFQIDNYQGQLLSGQLDRVCRLEQLAPERRGLNEKIYINIESLSYKLIITWDRPLNGVGLGNSYSLNNWVWLRNGNSLDDRVWLGNGYSHGNCNL